MRLCFIYLCRAYAATIKRPFELRYEPYTESVEVMHTPARIAKAVNIVKDQLATITNALNKLNASSKCPPV